MTRGWARTWLGVFLLAFAVSVAVLHPIADPGPAPVHQLREVDTPSGAVALGAYWGAAADPTTAGRYW